MADQFDQTVSSLPSSSIVKDIVGTSLSISNAKYKPTRKSKKNQKPQNDASNVSTKNLPTPSNDSVIVSKTPKPCVTYTTTNISDTQTPIVPNHNILTPISSTITPHTIPKTHIAPKFTQDYKGRFEMSDEREKGSCYVEKSAGNVIIQEPPNGNIGMNSEENVITNLAMQDDV